MCTLHSRLVVDFALLFQADSFFHVPFDEDEDLSGHDTSGIELITFRGPLDKVAERPESSIEPGPKPEPAAISDAPLEVGTVASFACVADVHRSADDPRQDSESCL